MPHCLLNREALEQLRPLLRTMTPRTGLYKVLREELTRLGHWKGLPRGRPFDESGRHASQTDANDDY